MPEFLRGLGSLYFLVRHFFDDTLGMFGILHHWSGKKPQTTSFMNDYTDESILASSTLDFSLLVSVMAIWLFVNLEFRNTFR